MVSADKNWYNLALMAKYLIVPDLHYPMYSRVFYSRILWELKSNRFDGLIQLGDAIDCPQLGIYPYSAKRVASLYDEIKGYGRLLGLMGRLLLANNPKAKVWQLEGNHEARLRRYIHSNAKELHEMVRSIPESLNLAALNGLWCPLDSLKSCEIGSTVVHHGHYFTKAIAKQNLSRYPYNFIQGHTHRLQWASDSNHWSLSLGCGCDITKVMHTPTEPNWTIAYAILNTSPTGDYPDIYYQSKAGKWECLPGKSLIDIKSLVFD